jgi:hypothetical protein
MACFRPHGDVISRMLDRQTVILDLHSGEYFGLNETGARIWQLLDGRDTSEIAEVLTREFEVSPTEAATAVNALIQQLLDKRLVEGCGESSGA